MAYKEVTSNAIDIKKDEGKAYEGVYTGRRDITTKIGPQVIWEFMGPDGMSFGIYGFTNLDSVMKSQKNGAKLRVTYTGKQKDAKTKYGLKDVHKVKVEVDTPDADEIPF